MPTLSRPWHVLAVHNVAISSEWYQQKLGFEEFLNMGNDWRFVRRDGIAIMLGQCPDEISASENGNHSYFAYWHVDDASALFVEWQANGVEMLKNVRDEEWGMREFALRTIDGHRIMVGQNLE